MAKPKKPSVKVKDLGPKNDPKGGKIVDKTSASVKLNKADGFSLNTLKGS